MISNDNIFNSEKSDLIGAFASGLCMVHCAVTPFIFIAQTCSMACCDAAPAWWRWIDYFFLLISFFAIIQSTKFTVSKWIKPALWLAWGGLVFTVFNETNYWLNMGKNFKYVPALFLVGLHLYNLKFCRCKEEFCCEE